MKKLTKERKLEIISKLSANYRSTSVNSGKIKVTDSKIQRRETLDGSEKRILTLRIQTDSDSPIYDDGWGSSYIERIDSQAFDQSLQEVNMGERIIYSFLDHKMEIDAVISSTQREGTKFYKDTEGNYIYEMELDPSNAKHKQLITMGENNEFKGNSFIFLPEVIEVEEAEDSAEYDYIVIQKRGELLSVDAVVYPFYPQNDITLKGQFMTEAQKREAEKAKQEAEAAKVAAEAKAAEEKAAEEKAAADKTEAEKKAQEEADAKAAEELAAKEAEAKAAEEKAAADKAEAEQKAKEEELDKSSEFKALSIAEQRSFLNGKLTARQIIDQINGDVNKEAAAKRAAMAEKLLKSKETNMEKDLKIKRDKMLSKLTKRGFGAVASNGKAFDELKEDIATALAERNTKFLDELGIADSELALFGLTRSGLTGADNASGASIIPVSTDPTVVGQIGVSLPEFDGASRMAMDGLEEKKVPVDVDTLGVAVAKEEGEEADEDTETVVKVQFVPTRFPKTFDYNPLLASHATVVSQKTTNAQNSIKRAWLNTYYSTLLAHKAATFAALATAGTYAGGITSDAKAAEISVAAGTGATQETMDALILAFEARYGTVAEGTLKAEMKPATWLSIQKDARANGNSALIRVAKGKTLYGAVEVIVRNEFPEDASKVGNVAIVLSVKANTKIYGGVLVQKDSIEQAFKKELSTRLIVGRGQAKLCDPHFTTFAAFVVA